MWLYKLTATKVALCPITNRLFLCTAPRVVLLLQVFLEAQKIPPALKLWLLYLLAQTLPASFLLLSVCISLFAFFLCLVARIKSASILAHATVSLEAGFCAAGVHLFYS